MNKISSLILLILATFSSSIAQISISQKDMFKVGMDLMMYFDTTTNTLNFGNLGSGQSWDFSMVSNDMSLNYSIMNPSSVPGSSYFPTATAAIENFATNVEFYENTANELIYLGTLVAFLDTQIYYHNYNFLEYPATLGSKHSAVGDGNLSLTFFSGIDPDGAGPHPVVDSIGFYTRELYESHFDAEGNLITPVGEYEVLRQSYKMTYVDSLYMYAAGSWQPASNALINISMFPAVESDTTYGFSWLANDAGLPVFTVNYDPFNGNSLLSAQWSSFLPTGISSSEVIPNVSAYPNPVFDELFIENNDSETLYFSLMNTAGSTVISGEVAQRNSIDLSYLEKGLYFLHLEKDGVTEVRKVLKM